MKVFLNDSIIPENIARISIFDHGFLYGDGIFETMRAYDGVVFKIDEHIKRLRRSANLIELNIYRTDNEIKSIIYKTLSENELKDAYIRITVSRGEGAIGLDPDLCKSPTLLVVTSKFKSYSDVFYENGIKIIIAKTRRNIREAINPEIKSLNFLNNILAKIEAKRVEAVEAIMLNAEGYITEGTISNIFFYKNDTLYTPSIGCGILDGITRNLVLELANSKEIKTEEGQYLPQDLFMADEIFITNTSMEVMPVGSVDNQKLSVGKITKLLQKEYINKRKIYNEF